jgi:hypothetical protein
MIIKSNFAERRKHHRFKVKDGALAEFYKPSLFKLREPRIAKSAPILELSGGGLTFQYISRDLWTPNLNELSISKPDNKLKIGKLPFRTITDFSISRTENAMSLRRCGVKFEELTSTLKYQLHYFIQNHTINNRPIDRRSRKNRRHSDKSQGYALDRRKGVERRKKLLPI